jgi:RNA polymerase sigma-70 factor (ECF subfamily)
VSAQKAGGEGKAIDNASIDRDTLLRRMMEAHGARVFSLCLRLARDYFLAEDLAQDTFLAAWQGLERFDGANEAAWLAKIATRKCLDYLRSAPARRSQAVGDEALLAFPAPEICGTEGAFFEGHWEETLRRACGALREPYRETALAYYCEGQTHAEIAERSGAPPDTVRTRCYRAKQMLRQSLKEEMRP